MTTEAAIFCPIIQILILIKNQIIFPFGTYIIQSNIDQIYQFPNNCRNINIYILSVQSSKGLKESLEKRQKVSIWKHPH